MATRNRVTATKIVAPKTHEGAPAAKITPVEELKRIIYTAMLGENTFYESGASIDERLISLVDKISDSKTLSDIAIIARTSLNIRHAPLFLAVAMAKSEKHRRLTGATLFRVINRADELGEALAMWDIICPNSPIPAQIKRTLRERITGFSEYQLAKYASTSGKKYSLKDVIRLTHPKPLDSAQSAAFGKIVAGELKQFDTWESALSAGSEKKSGSDKREAFTKLLLEGKMGGLAFLRNLRNMTDCGVSDEIIRGYFSRKNLFKRVIPFRYLSANDAAPMWGKELNERMLNSIADSGINLPGKTAILVDGSGSMMPGYFRVRGHGADMNSPIGKAAAIAAIGSEVCESSDIYVFSGDAKIISTAYRGIPLAEHIVKSAPGGGTYIGRAVAEVERRGKYDRIIVITDEQSHDVVSTNKRANGYVINVAPYKNRVVYGDKWVHVDGFSEAVFSWIYAIENDVLGDATEAQLCAAEHVDFVSETECGAEQLD